MDFDIIKNIGILLITIPFALILVGMTNKVISDSFSLFKASSVSTQQQETLTEYENTINESKNSWVFWLAIIIFVSLIIYILAMMSR